MRVAGGSGLCTSARPMWSLGVSRCEWVSMHGPSAENRVRAQSSQPQKRQAHNNQIEDVEDTVYYFGKLI